MTADRNAVLASRIREARKRKGLSQEGLAALLGTSRRHVIRWEKGEHRPAGVYAQRLATVLEQDNGAFDRDGSDEDDEESELVADLLHTIRKIIRAEEKRERKAAVA